MSDMSQGKANTKKKKKKSSFTKQETVLMVQTYDYMFLSNILGYSLDYNIPNTFYSTLIHLILSTVLQHLTM